MALAETLAGIFFIVAFFSLLTIFIILRLGGHSFRNYLKSKFGPTKKSGAWIIQFDKDKRVKLKFKKLPKDKKIKIKSGDIPEDDQYAYVNDVYHQLDSSGNPVILTLEDFPFPFFLKKHHLDNFFPTIEKMTTVIDDVIANGTDEDIETLKIKIKKRFIKAKNELKYIPEAWKKYKLLTNLDNIIERSQEYNNPMSNKESLKAYKKVLIDMRHSLEEANHQVVNAYDLFETAGFVQNITKTAMSEYQNGFLAAKQTQSEKKVNMTTMILMIIIGVFVLVSIYMTYSQGKDMTLVQDAVMSNTEKVDQLYQYINPEGNEPITDDIKVSNKQPSGTPPND
jgi:hypothetical protein